MSSSSTVRLSQKLEGLTIPNDSHWHVGHHVVENNRGIQIAGRFKVATHHTDRRHVTDYYIFFYGNPKHMAATLCLCPSSNGDVKELLVSYQFMISNVGSDEEIWSSEMKTEPFKDTFSIRLPKEHIQTPYVLKVKFCVQKTLDEEEKIEALNSTKKIMLNFSKFLNKQEYSDVELHCGGKIFYASRVVLSKASEVFDAMFRNNMSETLTGKVEIVGHDPKVFELLLKYIYSGKLSENPVQLCKLIPIADYYQVKGLTDKCIDSLIRMSDPNAGEEALKSYSLKNKKLLKACTIYSQMNVNEIVGSIIR